MACGPCMQQRHQFLVSARRFDLRGAAAAVTRGAAIAADKMRGIDVNAKYGSQQPAVKATPYRRPQPERST